MNKKKIQPDGEIYAEQLNSGRKMGWAESRGLAILSVGSRTRKMAVVKPTTIVM